MNGSLGGGGDYTSVECIVFALALKKNIYSFSRTKECDKKLLLW